MSAFKRSILKSSIRLIGLKYGWLTGEGYVVLSDFLDMHSTSDPQNPSSCFPFGNSASCLEWRTVMALGLSEAESKALVKSLAVHQLMKMYRLHLLKHGINAQDAADIASAIAYYDTFGHLRNSQQQALLNQYCVELCRANLWRSELLEAAIQ